MRLIDADALIKEAMELYCKDCERRKGVKNGKWKIVYSIGDAPCRACGTGDMIDELEDAPTIEERKTGKWLETDSHEPCWFKCDQCGRLSDIKEIYCPTCGASMANTTCGADMRGEGHE